jgi:chaperonin GroEL (HSP60 family)
LVSQEEIGSTQVVVFRNETEKSGISTIIVRAATQNTLDDFERAIGTYSHFFLTNL